MELLWWYNRLYIPLPNQGVYNNLGYPTVKVLSYQEWNLYLFCIKHKYQQENCFFHPLYKSRLYIPLFNQGVYTNLGYPTVKVLSYQEWNLYRFCIKHKYQQENLFFPPPIKITLMLTISLYN